MRSRDANAPREGLAKAVSRREVLALLGAGAGLLVLRRGSQAQVGVPNGGPPAASDIVALHSTPYGEDPGPVLRAFDIDCVGWGLPPQRASEVEGWAKAWIRRHLDAGVRYHAVLSPDISNGYLTGPEPEVLATRCVTANGEFRGPRHTGVAGVINGQPSWWHCVNHPGWLAQLKRQVGYILEAGAQGVQFDDPRANANPQLRQEGLCFCEHCLTGFEETRPGLELEGAELKSHLAAQAAARPTYPGDALLRQYYVYQTERAVRFIEELIAHARSLRPDGLQFSVNAFDLRPEGLAFVPLCDWVLAEMSHYAELWNDATIPRSLAWRYRLADAFGKRMVTSAVLWDWRYLQEHNCDELLKLWFAAAYAHGHLYTAPNYYDWSGKPYRADATDWAPLIRFVQDSAALLDDYVHVSSAAVLYSPDDLSDITGVEDKPLAELMDIATTFAYRHLDFDFAFARNSFFEPPEWPHAPMLIVPQTATLHPAEVEELERYEETGRLVRWPEERMKVEPLRTIEVPEGVWVKPRVHRADPDRRVFHLINGRFDYEANEVRKMEAFPLRFTMPEARQGVEVVYHAPAVDPVRLATRPTAGKAEVTIPSLRHWGIVALTYGD